MRLILRWIASAAAVAVAVYLLPGIDYDGRVETLLVVAAIFGLVNAIVRPIVKALACGLIVLTLGLFLFVINALMLLLTEALAKQFGYGFEVHGFVSALIGAIVISAATWIFSIMIPDERR
ncbi:MAG TPA: phage holin family protein [Longimicrobium sp.]|nr:phage holin family protein [Longimicrobium sp.]